MIHCKKIISSILTLTLFAGSVVSSTCFAAGTNSDKPNTEQSQQEKSSDFDKCRSYASELDEIKNSVNEKSSIDDLNKAFDRLNSLKSKLSENDKIVLAEHINATESYLHDKAFQKVLDLWNKMSSENKKLTSALKSSYVVGFTYGVFTMVIYNTLVEVIKIICAKFANK